MLSHLLVGVRGIVCGVLMCSILILSWSPSSYAEEYPRSPGWMHGTALPGLPPTAYPWLRLEINIAARELRVIESNRIVSTYKVAIGQAVFQSPEMSDIVREIIWNPSWTPPASPWAAGAAYTPPGPNNPLGPMKLPMKRGILVHGTPTKSSVGRAASHGCFRMHPDEAFNLGWYIQERATFHNDPSLREMYKKRRYRTFVVPLDRPVPVDIVYRPIEIRDGMVHLYPDTYGKIHNWEHAIQTALLNKGYEDTQINSGKLNSLRKQLHKEPVSVPIKSLVRPN